MTDPIVVTVPSEFFMDHDHRGCVTSSGYQTRSETIRLGKGSIIRPYVLRETKNRVTVALSPEDLEDLASDAAHYASSARDYGWEHRHVCGSALSTLVALDRQGVELTETGRGLVQDRAQMMARRAKRRKA